MSAQRKAPHQLKIATSSRVTASNFELAAASPSFGCIAWSALRNLFFGDCNAALLLSLPCAVLEEGVDATRFLSTLPLDQGIIDHALQSDRARPLDVPALDGVIYRLVFSAQNDGWFAFILRVDSPAEADGVRDVLLANLIRDARNAFYLLNRAGQIVFASGIRVAGGSRAIAAPVFGFEWATTWMGQGRFTAAKMVEAAGRGQSGQFEEYAFAPDGTLHRWHVRVTPILSQSLQKTDTLKSDYILCDCRDLTDLTQDHERLQLALYAGAISGGWIWDAKARLLRGDQRLAATLVVSVAQMAEGLTLRQLWQRVAADDLPQLRKAFKESAQARTRLTCELRVKASDGQGWIWVEADGLWESNNEGHVVALPGILLDIDEKKRQALKREALLEFIDGLRHLRQEHAILNLSSQVMGETIEADRAAFADVDTSRNLVVITSLWCRASAYEDLAMMASFQPLHGLYAKLQKGEVVAIPDVRTHPLTQHHAAELSREKICALFYVPLFEDGVFKALAMVHFSDPHRWDRINSSFLLTVADRGWAALLQNRAQDELKRVNGNLEEQVSRRTRERDCIWAITDDLLASMNFEGRLQQVNPSWARCAEPDITRHRGQMLSDLIHPQDRQKFSKMLLGLRTNQIGPSTDLRLRLEDETWHTFNWSGFRENKEIFLIGRDITERIVLEDQLRQSQKMEAVGQLTGGLAHDFNNILGGIGGALGLMRQKIGRGEHVDLARYVQAAQEAADRAAALTHRLLAFSRQQTLDPTLTDINALVSGMSDFLRRSLGPTVRLALELDEKVGTILIDRNQLENALLNLCINARDAMPEGGDVTISTAVGHDVTSSAAAATPSAILSVSDTGFGMEPHVVVRAFDPFFTTKPIGKGTGLGLSMIYGFASQSGGHVDIASAPGAGTSVHIWLPLSEGSKKPEPPAAIQTKKKKRVDYSRLKLLLVEDDATMRFTLHEMLMERGIPIDVTETGAAALTLLSDADRHYDVLMTDVGLPGGVNGRQLADAARAKHPKLAVLFMTGFAEQTVFADKSFDGSMQILFKPFSMEMLDEKLSRVVEHSAFSRKIS